MQVPWAAPQGRFTLLFERFAVEVLLASASVSQACTLLGIGWDTAQEIMRRAAQRGLERRQLDRLKYLGMDEKSFRRGQSYITLLTDLEESRVLDVVEEQTAEAAGQLWDTLSPEQKQGVEAVAVDMWAPFIQTIQTQVPEADIVHDKFHVSSYLGEAVDKVRRQEHKELLAQGDETLKGTRQLWLYNPQNFSPEQAEEFSALKDLQLKVARAWAAKELFSKFWEYQEEGWARRFFKDWFGWVSRSRLKPVVEVAQMLKRHLDNLLTYLKPPRSWAGTPEWRPVFLWPGASVSTGAPPRKSRSESADQRLLLTLRLWPAIESKPDADILLRAGQAVDRVPTRSPPVY